MKEKNVNTNTKRLLILISIANIFNVSAYAAEKRGLNLIDKFNNCKTSPLFGNVNCDENNPYISDSSSESEDCLSTHTVNFHPLPKNYGSQKNQKKSKKFNLDKIPRSKLSTSFIRMKIKFPENTPQKLAYICETLLLKNLNLYDALCNYSIDDLEYILEIINTSKIPYELNDRKQDLILCINQIRNNSSIDISKFRK